MKNMMILLAGLVISTSAFANPSDWLICKGANLQLNLAINGEGDDGSFQLLSTQGALGAESDPRSAEVPSDAFSSMMDAGHFDIDLVVAATGSSAELILNRTNLTDYTGSYKNGSSTVKVTCTPAGE